MPTFALTPIFAPPEDPGSIEHKVPAHPVNNMKFMTALEFIFAALPLVAVELENTAQDKRDDGYAGRAASCPPRLHGPGRKHDCAANVHLRRRRAPPHAVFAPGNPIPTICTFTGCWTTSHRVPPRSMAPVESMLAQIDMHLAAAEKSAANVHTICRNNVLPRACVALWQELSGSPTCWTRRTASSSPCGRCKRFVREAIDARRRCREKQVLLQNFTRDLILDVTKSGFWLNRRAHRLYAPRLGNHFKRRNMIDPDYIYKPIDCSKSRLYGTDHPVLKLMRCEYTSVEAVVSGPAERAAMMPRCRELSYCKRQVRIIMGLHGLLQAGPCPLQAHEKERIRRQQLASASHLPALPDSGSVTHLLGGNFTTSEEWMSMSLRPMQAFDRWQEREQDHGNAAAVIRRLDNLYGVKSPTPETETVREQFAREEPDIAASWTFTAPPPISHSASWSSPLPICIAGAASRALPYSLHLFILVSTSTRPNAGPRLSTRSCRHRQRSCYASSRSKAQTGHKRAEVDPTFADHHPAQQGLDRSEWGLIRHPAAAAPPTFHTGALSLGAHGWFQELQPPAAITVDHCPSWPDYVFDDPTLARLGIDVVDIELYSPIHGTFIRISTKYVHTVSTDSVILLRRPGIRRPDQPQIIDVFLLTSKPIHLRYNIGGERAMVRAAYKQQDKEPIMVDDDSDVEVQVTSGKHRIKREAGASPPRQRPRLQIDTSIAGLSTASSPALSSTASLSALSSTPSSSSALPTPSTPATTPLPSPKPSSRTWPRGLYVLELALGFAIMNDPKNKHLARSERFQTAFGHDFKYVYGTWNEILRTGSPSRHLRNERMPSQRERPPRALGLLSARGCARVGAEIEGLILRSFLL
ncbi:hypothetical protein B0H14DRAFT_3159623 [Mycena olivaceomarginata]|nr:hypothetical protein B0H14DRAFT_3159623 [Mycena olivaceomarginata]